MCIRDRYNSIGRQNGLMLGFKADKVKIIIDDEEKEVNNAIIGREKQQVGNKGLDFKHKEVINIKDGKRLGFVQDVCADLESWMITSIIVPGNNKILNMFSGSNEIVIEWSNIKCIGCLLYTSRGRK